ncbi:MAG: hypothetical protein NTZ14_13565 [Hyphomicrobiales bacterium]|nr:hypothetical protein [Hyphomicrobiales bacterium]
MPLPNRVTPSGDLEASSARGLFFGNRGGRFHDVATRRMTGRPWASRQWITCQCDFKGRATRFRDDGRAVWDGSRYTELFFLDEVTALAAGHRPCMECRRDDAMAYRRATVAGGAFAMLVPCPALDTQLDQERRTGRAKRLHSFPYGDLPDGAMIRIGAAAHAVRGAQLLVWSQAGYTATLAMPRGIAACLTPPTNLAALRSGYLPVWHPSATLIGSGRA